jgi:hypothetical protein
LFDSFVSCALRGWVAASGRSKNVKCTIFFIVLVFN